MTLWLYTDELLNRQTIIFHSASLIWSILFNLSSLIGTNIIFKFFANIFSTIFIMLAIFNLILLAAARDDTERATWIVLLSLMTGPTSITSFTLILWMNYSLSDIEHLYYHLYFLYLIAIYRKTLCPVPLNDRDPFVFGRGTGQRVLVL